VGGFRGFLCFFPVTKTIEISYNKVLCWIKLKIKVKESRNIPGVAQRVPGGLGSQISWHLAHEGGEVSLTHRPPLPPGMFLDLIFTRGWVDPRAMVWSEWNMSLKNPVTPPGIDPGTVWIVAQHLNHCAIPQASLCWIVVLIVRRSEQSEGFYALNSVIRQKLFILSRNAGTIFFSAVACIHISYSYC